MHHLLMRTSIGPGLWKQDATTAVQQYEPTSRASELILSIESSKVYTMRHATMTNGFQVQDDGTSIEVEVTKDSLESENVYCIIDDASKSIFIWKGRRSGVRKKFIGAQTANRMRSEYGTTFKVHSLDEGEEPAVFFIAISNNSGSES
jgi:hypothetical protein